MAKKVKRKRLPSMAALRRKLDTVFSAFIRRRDTNANGFGVCVSCGRTVSFADGNAGHWIPRQHLATRYHEKNVHLQCVGCNLYRHGNLLMYTLWMQGTYGCDVVSELLRLRRTSVKLTRADYMDLIDRFSKAG